MQLQNDLLTKSGYIKCVQFLLILLILSGAQSKSYRNNFYSIETPTMATCIAITVTILIFATLYALHYTVSQAYPPIPKLTQVWETKPIVSIYVSDADQGGFCNSGYEPVLIADDFSLASVSEGPCACVENSLSLQSTNAMCPKDLHESELCTSMSALPAILNVLYRGASICIKRGGVPAATYRKEKFRSRPHPDYYGNCPTGQQMCGAICFPATSQCPITNLLVLPINKSVPVDQGWESAGIFVSEDTVLYVRRNQPHELPIVDIVPRLTEITAQNANVRGQCYEGPVQVPNQPLLSDPNHRWSYTVGLPPVCEVVDPRYHLFDSVDLESHYLQNLQSAEPTCRAHELYPLSDPRYKSTLDPDYLNSGVKCGHDAAFPCARDPYQRTDCAAGDDICDGVVNQNICGAYTHAVRSAFSGSSATLGLYFAREIDWSAHCVVSKEFIYTEAMPTFRFIQTSIWWIAFFWLLQAGVYMRNQQKEGDCALFYIWLGFSAYWLYTELGNLKAIRDGECMDPFTTDVLVSGLQDRVKTCLMLLFVLLVLFTVVSWTKPDRPAPTWSRPVPVRVPARTTAVSARPAVVATTSAHAVPVSAAGVPATATVSTANTATSPGTSFSGTATSSAPATVSAAATPMASPVAVQMVSVDRGAYAPLLQNDSMV